MTSAPWERRNALAARPRRGTDVVAWELTAGAVAQLVLFGLLTVSVGLGPIGLLVGKAYIAVVGTALTLALHRSRTRALGPANRVTLTRATFVGGVTALVADGHIEGMRTVALVAIATVALILDAVDGLVARRTGAVSPLGARFDMEVDAFLILVLSVLVAGSLGAWVLMIGAMRYVFAAAAWVAPWLNRPLPRSVARKTTAALQGIVLVVASAEVTPTAVSVVLVAAALTLLVWSFGRDVVWLWRNERGVTSREGEPGFDTTNSGQA
jgi:phosphatidylglycerophosphate synthase